MTNFCKDNYFNDYFDFRFKFKVLDSMLLLSEWSTELSAKSNPFFDAEAKETDRPKSATSQS